MRCFFLLFFTLQIHLTLFADPWGKDADLIPKKKKEKKTSSPLFEDPLRAFGRIAIEFHQDYISQADGPRSHFFPSSSQYTKEAMSKYGFFQGYILGCDRLMRENSDEWIYLKINSPYGQLKWNPVP